MSIDTRSSEETGQPSTVAGMARENLELRASNDGWRCGDHLILPLSNGKFRVVHAADHECGERGSELPDLASAADHARREEQRLADEIEEIMRDQREYEQRTSAEVLIESHRHLTDRIVRWLRARDDIHPDLVARFEQAREEDAERIRRVRDDIEGRPR